MTVRIVDTTLRDGEQKAGTALRLDDKVRVAKLLDSLGIYQIEAGIPAMKGEEKKSICRILELGLKCRVSTWNRLSISDIKHSMECGSSIIHISTPVSDIQIDSKLKKNREWVVENLRKCVGFCREKGLEVTVGLEDASRADFGFILQVVEAALFEGAERIRYADTVGILHMQRTFDEFGLIKREFTKMDIEMHAHNDLGMAVANSISAVKAGADYVDCTIGGIGERAGNCNFMQFVKAAGMCFGLFKDADMAKLSEIEREVTAIIN